MNRAKEHERWKDRAQFPEFLRTQRMAIIAGRWKKSDFVVEAAKAVEGGENK